MRPGALLLLQGPEDPWRFLFLKLETPSRPGSVGALVIHPWLPPPAHSQGLTGAAGAGDRL